MVPGIKNPLIPANAGTQMANTSLGSRTAEALRSSSAPFDLGPGIRRDERLS
jgi:hypothetical protein